MNECFNSFYTQKEEVGCTRNIIKTSFRKKGAEQKNYVFHQDLEYNIHQSSLKSKEEKSFSFDDINQNIQVQGFFCFSSCKKLLSNT
jgi:hypothetical protein